MNYGKSWGQEKNKIEKILKNLEMYEEEIKHKFNVENVDSLIKSYNEAIEHYSAANDYLYNVYLNNLHNLLNREDVQVLMCNFMIL